MNTDQPVLDVSRSRQWVRPTLPVPREAFARPLRAVGAAAAILVPAPLLIWLFLHQFLPVPRMLLVGGAVLGAVAAAWVWQRELLIRRRRTLAAAIILTSGLAVGAGVLWNQSFVRFSAETSHHGIFRPSMQRFVSPSYGVPQYTPLRRGWPALVVGAGAMAALLLTRGQRMTALRMAVIVGFQIAAILTFASSEGHTRLAGHAWQFRPFEADAARFQSVGDLLARYVQEMPSLSWFGCHYPPGSALLFMLQAMAGGTWPLAFYVIVASAVGATVAVYFAARELSPRRPAVAWWATLAYAAATGPLVYASLSTTPLILLPAAASIWALLRAARTGSPLPAVVLGGCVIAFGMVSLSVSFFGVMLAILAMLSIAHRPYVLRTCAIALATILACVAVLKFAAGFDFLQCIRVGTQQHLKQIHLREFDGWEPFFVRSTGNLIAFILGNLPLIGIAVASLLLWRMRDWRRPRNAMLPAAAVAVVLAAFSGAFLLETERIWLFFIPPLAIAAAVELARYRRGCEARWVVAMMIAFALTQELGFIHYR